MKHIILILAVCLCVNSYAQNFEGTIKWTMKMEFSDPSMKAKMEDAQKQLNDPATQAKMAEMKKQMENPQMKAMMESNPQMKAMMEKAMSGSVGNMVPTGMIVKLKDGNSISSMQGGLMADMEILFLKEKGQTFNLNRKSKTYKAMNGAQQANTQSGSTKVSKTGETVKILSYTCSKYIVETNEGGRPATIFIWATTEIKDIDAKSFARARAGSSGNVYYEGIDGVPLKVEASTAEGKMVMEVTEIKKETLNTSDFTIPADFKEGKGMF